MHQQHIVPWPRGLSWAASLKLERQRTGLFQAQSLSQHQLAVLETQADTRREKVSIHETTVTLTEDYVQLV